MFDWLVARINESLLTDSETRAFIGVLDIFGFEQFEVNCSSSSASTSPTSGCRRTSTRRSSRRSRRFTSAKRFGGTRSTSPTTKRASRCSPIRRYAAAQFRRNSGAILRNYSETPPPLQARAGGSSTAPVGLFALLDEQCRLPKCTHKTFTEKIFEVRLGRVSDRGQRASSYTRAQPHSSPRSSLCRCIRRLTAWGRSAP